MWGSICLPWIVNYQKFTQLSWDCGVPLVLQLHLIFCFTIAIILLEVVLLVCAPHPFSWVWASGGQDLCHPVSWVPGTTQQHATKTCIGRGTKVWAICTWIPLKARRALLSLSYGGEFPADTLSTWKTNQSQVPRHMSAPKDYSLNVTPFASTTHTHKWMNS